HFQSLWPSVQREHLCGDHPYAVCGCSSYSFRISCPFISNRGKEPGGTNSTAAETLSTALIFPSISRFNACESGTEFAASAITRSGCHPGPRLVQKNLYFARRARIKARYHIFHRRGKHVDAQNDQHVIRASNAA